jgi:subtilase family serine protease
VSTSTSRRRSSAALLAATVVVIAVLGLRGEASGAAARRPAHKHRRVCTQAPAERAACHAEVVTNDDAVTPLAGPSPATDAYGPSDLQSAYALPGATAGVGQTVAIVDAYDNPNAESDLAAYRQTWGLPPCTTANGCFRKVNQDGNASPLPRGDVGWGQEIAVDLQAASATCPLCKLLLVEARSANLDPLGAGVDTAARLGAQAISNSYGSNEFNGETNYEWHYNHPGIAITVASGDEGFNPEFPTLSRYVTSVGGTRLTRSATARGWSETAWTGGSSGCSGFIPKPSWQKDTGCGRRTGADVAAVADPNTGIAVYDSYGSSGGNNWYVFGGTSVSSPIVAAVFAMGGASAPSYPYSHTASLFDVTSGSNGSCSPSYLCTAQAGYDGPTGLGTPNGTGAFGGPAVGVTTTTQVSTTTTSSSTSTTTTTISTTTTSTSTTSTSTTSTTVATTTTTNPSTTTTTKPPTTTTTTASTTTTTMAGGTLPSAPQGLKVTGTIGGVSLGWQPPANLGGSPVTYKIYRGGWGSETYLATTSATSYTDLSAPMWTYYFYRVAAVNATGQGPYTPDVGGQRTG